MSIGDSFNPQGSTRSSQVEVNEYEAPLFARRTTEIPSNMQARWVYNSSNQCLYAAYAPRGLAESANGWIIQKFTWVGENCTKREIAYSSYSNYLTATYA